jgi:hypothetical protein
MSLFRFSKLPKSKAFTFTPRYYDPVQEELEERAKQREMRKQDDLEGAKMRIRSGFKNKYKADANFTQKSKRQQNIRLLLIIGILLLGAYFVLTEFLPVWIQMIEKTE